MSESSRSERPISAITAALAGVAVGVVGALLWHFSVTSTETSIEMIALDSGTRFVQPPLRWWPVSGLIIAAAALWFGLTAYVFGTRIPSGARRPSRWALPSAAAVTGGLFGLGLAAAARRFPPQEPQPYVVPGDSSLTATDSVLADSSGSALDLPTRIPIEEQLPMFTVITAVVAILLVVGLTWSHRLITSLRRCTTG